MPHMRGAYDTLTFAVFFFPTPSCSLSSLCFLFVFSPSLAPFQKLVFGQTLFGAFCSFSLLRYICACTDTYTHTFFFLGLLGILQV
jgi:hypothetical protein